MYDHAPASMTKRAEVNLTSTASILVALQLIQVNQLQYMIGKYFITFLT